MLVNAVLMLKRIGHYAHRRTPTHTQSRTKVLYASECQDVAQFILGVTPPPHPPTHVMGTWSQVLPLTHGGSSKALARTYGQALGKVN